MRILTVCFFFEHDYLAVRSITNVDKTRFYTGVLVYIGENELNQGVVMVKNLVNKEQVFVPVSDVVAIVRQFLG